MIELTPIDETNPDRTLRRLRALLKAALRVYGFRCLRVEPMVVRAFLGDAPVADDFEGAMVPSRNDTCTFDADGSHVPTNMGHDGDPRNADS